MHVLEPFLPDLNLTPDHSLSDIEAECKALSQVQRMTSDFLRGELDLDTLDDCLFGYGVDPNEYWGIVEDNVDAVIESGTALEDQHLIVIAR
ncbi:hypothetical protein C7B65_22775 [Phormidesmis priestleyi ULC007]|uniref:Uncharacterized protein n=1 Tax=Phormidesmis priestleyi ULC007 TaxID=1920490 RepID=A0A2T1D6B0_9CYAN|nr:hypothetical protein [Phormidesmis priestleyi]PSB16052.1 hypothetical protein C7B65_22775 [Phormidesmis priestleyi ULC007]PZO52248.1 MAG: hypothetical protein DCF14_07225 [Phormidesmis priestleyi]